MTIYFANKGEIDLDVIRVMGVSVKMNENPIGFFGTGLKFALCTLLRTGHRVVMTTGGETYEFTAANVMIRDKEFQRIKMNDELLPFTTELGKTWEVWQAYREMHSNTLDESGTISNRPLEGDTVIAVTGVGIDQVYNERGSIFIEDREPVCANRELEIYEGETQFVYYRGVRCGVLPARACFTYNILRDMELSEDRQFSSLYMVELAVESQLPSMQCRAVADRILNGDEKWDQKLSFTLCGSPSAGFLDAAAEAAPNVRMNESAREVLEKYRQDEGQFEVLHPVSEEHQEIFVTGLVLAQQMGASITAEEITLVKTLGPGVFGMYHRKTGGVYIAPVCLDLGADHTAACIFEEWMHKEHKLSDYTRSFQDFVLQRLVQVTKKLVERSEP